MSDDSTPIGEEIITGSVQANPLMTESVAIEFEMFPSQAELALPDTLDELFIDLRVQEVDGLRLKWKSGLFLVQV